MSHPQKIAFIFPGQGAQFPGMGKEVADAFPKARRLYENADRLLNRNLSDIVFNGPEATLLETANSQSGIFVTSLAILEVLQEALPSLAPQFAAGLSLGEYTALVASKKLSFENALALVEKRGQLMNEACEKHQGTMAVVMGLEPDVVEALVNELDMPNDLWTANFNCPGQVVISGTLKGIEAGSAKAKDKGAKRVIPLSVHGAFHSGLMQEASDQLNPLISAASFLPSETHLVMNVSGKIVEDPKEIARALALQVTSPVRWEKGIREMANQGVDLFIEIGPGKTLAGMNKRIGIQAKTISIETVPEIEEAIKELSL